MVNFNAPAAGDTFVIASQREVRWPLSSVLSAVLRKKVREDTLRTFRAFHRYDKTNRTGSCSEDPREISNSREGCPGAGRGQSKRAATAAMLDCVNSQSSFDRVKCRASLYKVAIATSITPSKSQALSSTVRLKQETQDHVGGGRGG